MPRPELTEPRAVSTPPVIPALVTSLSGWGGGAGSRASLLRIRSTDSLIAAVAGSPRSRPGALARGAIARGMGRSYGDAAQLEGGAVLDMTALQAFQLDRSSGEVTAQAGVTIGRLLETLVPAGWILPAVPGTAHVTVGGAIASDVHGKNHAVAGTFGRHVLELGLLLSSGEVVTLTPERDRALFDATVGGMGLTGVILWARIALQRVGGPWLSVDSDRVGTLDAAFAALLAPGGEHRVAWLDLLGSGLARGVVTRAAHVHDGARGGQVTVPARATVPERWPSGLLNTITVRAYNEFRFRRAPLHERGRAMAFGQHTFPLDALERWPRLYGRQGLVQYQCALPRGEERLLEAVISKLRDRRVPCYLAVLKDLGEPSAAPLSFPLAGWALALDLPRAASGLGTTLDSLDELVAAAGGRVYLTKDARMRPEALAAMYPRLRDWREIRDRADPNGLWRSDLGLRTGLVGER
ncbi:MAG TPA: FAD-binding oxidoreductase [Solirubrobacteraceae bacterium]|jgi:decaprenylphospho-beta-D-ribofuranose 2-oxidase